MINKATAAINKVLEIESKVGTMVNSTQLSHRYKKLGLVQSLPEILEVKFN